MEHLYKITVSDGSGEDFILVPIQCIDDAIEEACDLMHYDPMDIVFLKVETVKLERAS